MRSREPLPVAVAELPHDTVRSVVSEAVDEHLARHADTHPLETSVEYVAEPAPGPCPSSVLCCPLGERVGLGELAVGHLHLDLRSTPDPVDPAARVDPATDLADLADRIVVRVARDLLDVRLAYARHEVAHLKVALETNRTIGVAVGVLMATHRCTAADAFDMLRTASQNQNRKLRDIALDVQDTGVILDRSPSLG